MTDPLIARNLIRGERPFSLSRTKAYSTAISSSVTAPLILMKKTYQSSHTKRPCERTESAKFENQKRFD